MRFKNRYLIARLHGSEHLTVASPQPIERYLRKQCLEMFGNVGGAVAVQSLVVKYLNNNIVVVRCGRDDVVKIRAVLTFITELDAQPCLFQVLTTSGSVRTCKKALLAVQSDWHSTIDSSTKEQDHALINDMGL